MRHQTDAQKSFQDSLRWSLHHAIGLDRRHEIRIRYYLIEAETECLVSYEQQVPDTLDLLLDVEMSPGEWERFWFELHRIDDPGHSFDDHGNEIAVYNAFCDSH